MRRPTFHIIPATILAAGLVLTIKIGSIWYAVSGQAEAELVSVASAEEPSTQAKNEADPPPTAESAPSAPASLVETGEGDQASSPFSYTSAEIELLQKLSARREELEKRERELDMRENLLKAAEQQLEAKSAQLAAMQEKLEALVHTYNEQENKKLESLVKIYEQMKPKDAARIMNDLDMEVLLDVMQRMKEARAAPILADMDPERARAVTSRLAERGSPAGPAVRDEKS